jgi:hypothetical protein
MSGLIRYITFSFCAIDSRTVLYNGVRSSLSTLLSLGTLLHLQDVKENLQQYVVVDFLVTRVMTDMRTH